MPNIYNYSSLAELLTKAEPVQYPGEWSVIKGGLLKSGEISESGGVVQKVFTVSKGASSGATSGETISGLCAVKVSPFVTATGEAATLLTPVSAIAWTPKSVAILATMGCVGLDVGFRLGQNLVNLYFGDDWDWHAPGIFDLANDKVRTFVDKDGFTYFDEETIVSITNRLNDIGAFNDGSYVVDEVVLGGSYSFSGINTNNIPAYTLSYLPNLLANIKTAGLPDRYENDFTKVFFNTGTDYRGKEYWQLSLTYNPMSYTKYPLVYENRLYVSNVGYTTDEKYIKLFNKGLKNGNFSDASIYEIRFFSTTKVPNGWYTSYVRVFKDGEVLYGNEDNIYANSCPIDIPGNPDEIVTYNIGHATSAGIDGVTKQQGAVIPTSFPLDIPSTYPSWIPSYIPNPDANPAVYPATLPDSYPGSNPATNPQPDAQTGLNPNPDNNPDLDDVIDTNDDNPSPRPNPDPEPGDTGDVKPKPKPVGGIIGTGFVAIYNPTQSQLSEFSQYLWSNDFIDNVKKLFQDPMDALVGLHMIYATPVRGEDSNIICGYLDSGVNSHTVSDQYISIDCGSIKINKYFGNVLDYNPYTKIQCYLPFIGVVDLDTNELMDKTLNILYNIDVLTGACLAQLCVKSNNYSAVLYTFSGNCAVQLPITGGNYSSIIANTIGVGASIGATIASGGALAPVAVAGVASSLSNSRLNVSKSGSLGSNAGALGNKIPYLIITRPIQYNASNYSSFYGIPSNITTYLYSCSGFTRVKDVHVEKINATDTELSEIESLLKEGVII